MSQITKGKHYKASILSNSISTEPGDMHVTSEYGINTMFFFFFYFSLIAQSWLVTVWYHQFSTHIPLPNLSAELSATPNTSSSNACWWSLNLQGLLWQHQETAFCTYHRFGDRPLHKFSGKKKKVWIASSVLQKEVFMHRFEGENPYCSINNKQ